MWCSRDYVLAIWIEKLYQTDHRERRPEGRESQQQETTKLDRYMGHDIRLCGRYGRLAHCSPLSKGALCCILP